MVLTSSAIEGRRHFQILSFQTNCLTSFSIALREDPLPQSLGVAGKEYFNNFVVNPPFRDHFHRKTGKQLPSLDVSSGIDFMIIGWKEITSELVLLTWCQKRAIAVLTLLTPLHRAAPDSFLSFDSFANGRLKYGRGSSLRILEQPQEFSECILHLRLTIFQMQSGAKVFIGTFRWSVGLMSMLNSKHLEYCMKLGAHLNLISGYYI